MPLAPLYALWRNFSTTRNIRETGHTPLAITALLRELNQFSTNYSYFLHLFALYFTRIKPIRLCSKGRERTLRYVLNGLTQGYRHPWLRFLLVLAILLTVTL